MGFVVVGLAAAAAGLALLLTPVPVTVTLDSTGYRIGAHRLVPGRAGTYIAPEAYLVIVHRDSGTVAAASSRLHGQPLRARCDLPAAGTFEYCTFQIGTATITSEDIRTPLGWHRRYADGQEVDIRISGGRSVPVPFPVGR